MEINSPDSPIDSEESLLPAQLLAVHLQVGGLCWPCSAWRQLMGRAETELCTQEGEDRAKALTSHCDLPKHSLAPVTSSRPELPNSISKNIT